MIQISGLWTTLNIYQVTVDKIELMSKIVILDPKIFLSGFQVIPFNYFFPDANFPKLGWGCILFNTWPLRSPFFHGVICKDKENFSLIFYLLDKKEILPSYN